MLYEDNVGEDEGEMRRANVVVPAPNPWWGMWRPTLGINDSGMGPLWGCQLLRRAIRSGGVSGQTTSLPAAFGCESLDEALKFLGLGLTRVSGALGAACGHFRERRRCGSREVGRGGRERRGE